MQPYIRLTLEKVVNRIVQTQMPRIKRVILDLALICGGSEL